MCYLRWSGNVHAFSDAVLLVDSEGGSRVESDVSGSFEHDHLEDLVFLLSLLDVSLLDDSAGAELASASASARRGVLRLSLVSLRGCSLAEVLGCLFAVSLFGLLGLTTFVTEVILALLQRHKRLD